MKHVVHLGACGRDDTTVAHWAWHQFVERYIEWTGFSYTHLRPETFMQNMLSYGGEKAIKGGVIHAYVEGARLSWVDVNDVAWVAAVALMDPERHGGKTYRLGYEAATFYELADMMTSIVGKPFRYEPLAPEVFLKAMQDAGAEMAYMGCVYDHWKRYAAGTIPRRRRHVRRFPRDHRTSADEVGRVHRKAQVRTRLLTERRLHRRRSNSARRMRVGPLFRRPRSPSAQPPRLSVGTGSRRAPVRRAPTWRGLTFRGGGVRGPAAFVFVTASRAA